MSKLSKRLDEIDGELARTKDKQIDLDMRITHRHIHLAGAVDRRLEDIGARLPKPEPAPLPRETVDMMRRAIERSRAVHDAEVTWEQDGPPKLVQSGDTEPLPMISETRQCQHCWGTAELSQFFVKNYCGTLDYEMSYLYAQYECKECGKHTTYRLGGKTVDNHRYKLRETGGGEHGPGQEAAKA